MKSQTHTLRNKTDQGAESDLFTLLRENATEPAVKRVEKVLTLLVEADALTRAQREQKRILERSGEDWHKSKSFVESKRASDRTFELLNAELRRYPSLPLAYPDRDGFCIVDRPVTTSKGRWAYRERVAVGTLLKLAKTPGGLSRLRRCLECQQWFYAIRSHQQFCGESCRRRHTAQDPDFKEMRARYMRETYRPMQKDLDQRSVTLAKRKR